MSLAHSYSSLAMYEQCPKKFEYIRINKEVKEDESEALEEGKRVHKALELRVAKQKQLPQDLEHLEGICAQFPANRGEVYAELELCIDKEHKVRPWRDWSNGWMRAKVDLVYVLPNKTTAIVVDWKTGKRRPDKFQLALSALMVFIHYPQVTKIQSLFVWTQTKEQDFAVYHRHEMPMLWQEVYAKVKQVEDSLKKKSWPAKPSKLCGWCAAKNICPHANLT